jgi:hypothetical protein
MLQCMTAAQRPAVVGVADHSGWANLVTLGVRDGRAAVVDRRRCELIGPDLPRQPYHAAEDLSAAEAEDVVARVTAAAAAGAEAALTAVVSDLVDHDVVAVALRAAGGQPLPDTVAGVLASHSAMHAAEGQLYRDALADAAAGLGIASSLYERRGVEARAAAHLGVSEAELASLVAELGRRLGPPWRAEHKEATAAALCELADHADVTVAR